MSKSILAAAVAGLFGTTAVASAESAAPRVVAVKVTGDGFAPAEIRIAKGEATKIVFTRTTDATCAKAVAFPELGIEKPLPLNGEVSIEVPVASARTLTFQCGMGMFKSRVIIQ